MSHAGFRREPRESRVGRTRRTRTRENTQGRRIAALPHILTGQCASRPLRADNSMPTERERISSLFAGETTARVQTPRPGDRSTPPGSFSLFLSLSLSLSLRLDKRISPVSPRREIDRRACVARRTDKVKRGERIERFIYSFIDNFLMAIIRALNKNHSFLQLIASVLIRYFGWGIDLTKYFILKDSAENIFVYILWSKDTLYLFYIVI